MVTAALAYQAQVHDLHAHLFAITLTVPQPSEGQRVSFELEEDRRGKQAAVNLTAL